VIYLVGQQRLEVDRVVVAGVDEADLGAYVGGEELDHVVAKRLGGRHHVAVLEQEEHHVGRGAVQPRAHVLGRRAPLDDDLALGDGGVGVGVAGGLGGLDLLEGAPAAASGRAGAGAARTAAATGATGTAARAAGKAARAAAGTSGAGRGAGRGAGAGAGRAGGRPRGTSGCSLRGLLVTRRWVGSAGRPAGWSGVSAGAGATAAAAGGSAGTFSAFSAFLA